MPTKPHTGWPGSICTAKADAARFGYASGGLGTEAHRRSCFTPPEAAPPPASSRLRHITGVLLETALTDSGVEDARKRRRSACRSIWALWSRCRRLCNCLEPVRLERTL